MSDKRVAIVANAGFYVGPDLARLLASKGHDLVLGDPADGLVDELTAAGAAVETVTGVLDLGDTDASTRLVAAALERFGRVDSAVMFSGLIIQGRLLDASLDDLQQVTRGNVEAPFHFLQATLPPMVEAGGGQVLIITSASGLRPTWGAPLYSSTRAAANMLVKNAAMEVSRNGVQVNSVGTNFMDFPAFRAASGADDPEIRARIEAQVPMRRLGSMEEFAAFCAVFCDGTSGFTTGQNVGYAGGWDAL